MKQRNNNKDVNNLNKPKLKPVPKETETLSD